MARILTLALIGLLLPLAALADGGDERTPLAPAELERLFREAVLAHSPWQARGEIVIESVRAPLCKVAEKDRAVVQAKFAPREDFLGFTTLTLSFGAAETVKTTVTGMVRVFMTVPVTRNDIRRGAVMGPEDLELRRIDITRYPPIALDREACAGKRAKSLIRAASPVLLANIDVPPLVFRGAPVYIEAGGDDLIVTDRGIALADGRIDERIPVKNARSGRQIVGTVIAASRIRVEY